MRNFEKALSGSKKPSGLSAFALIALSVLLLASCTVSRKRITSHTTSVDSIRITQTVRDTVVRIERDSSMLRALIECDSTGRATLRELVEYRAGQRAEIPLVKIADNILTVQARVDSVEIFMQLRERYSERIRAETITVREEIEVNRITPWQRFWIRTGQVLALAAAVLIGAGLRKRIFR